MAIHAELPAYPGAYYSYLVRLWQENPQAPWRASARCVQSGELTYFATVEALLLFLQAQTCTATLATDLSVVEESPANNLQE